MAQALLLTVSDPAKREVFLEIHPNILQGAMTARAYLDLGLFVKVEETRFDDTPEGRNYYAYPH